MGLGQQAIEAIGIGISGVGWLDQTMIQVKHTLAWMGGMAMKRLDMLSEGVH